MYLAGPFKGAPLQPGRDHPGPGRPLRLRHRRRPGRPPHRPARRPRHRRLRNGARDHRRHPDPDALDPGQHRQAELHDQPDQLLARSRSPRRASATRGRSAELQLLLPGGQLRARSPFKPKMTIRQLGGRKATGRARTPSLEFDLTTRPGDANIKSVAVTLPKAFEIDQRHLGNLCSESRTRGDAMRRPASRSAPRRRRRRCSNSRSRARSTRSPATAACRDSPSSSTARSTLVPAGESKRSTQRRLRTTVPVVPDAPIGHFRLTLFGGKQGYLANTRDLCGKPPRASVEYIAQNGKTPDPEGQDEGPLRGRQQLQEEAALGPLNLRGGIPKGWRRSPCSTGPGTAPPVGSF